MKRIIWRLKEQPSTESLLALVNGGLMTKDEAKEVLFSSEEQEDRDKKSLESEIKFLRELVEKLSNRSETVKIIGTIQPRYVGYPWYQPYQYWCSGTTGIHYSADNVLGSSTSRTVGTGTYTSANSSFADIKTF